MVWYELLGEHKIHVMMYYDFADTIAVYPMNLERALGEQSSDRATAELT